MTENEIIRGCIEGYPEFQKALYDTYYKKMMGICIRYSENENEAHQMLQDGFLNIYRNIRKHKENESFDVWLKKTMVDTAITYIRNDKEKRMIVSTVHEIKGIPKQKPKEITDGQIIPKLKKEQILKAIHSLTSGYRIVLNLYLVDGFTYEQIAELLNVSTDTCKSNLEKALFAFRKSLIQQINTDGE